MPLSGRPAAKVPELHALLHRLIARESNSVICLELRKLSFCKGKQQVPAATESAKPREAPLLRWLHLTDLHVGKNNESQRTALASLLSAVNSFAEDKPFDVVLLTGDLAFSGERHQYDAFQTLLIDPLRASKLCKDATFFAVPGNHDLNCEIGFPPIWRELGRNRQENFFHLEDTGRRTRSGRAEAFKDYSDFVNRAGIRSADPLSTPALLLKIEGRQRPIAIISAVTAFFSDKDISDYQRAPAPIHPLRTLLQGLSEDAQPIILGHHPLEWFIPETEQHLHSLLVEHNSLYLHGHEHRIRARFGARGLLSLGFGAAYQATSESPPTPYYRNSFAICELAESLHVCFASWDAENGRWRSDQNLQADFRDRSELLREGYCLPLPTTRLLERRGPPAHSLASAIRHELSIERCIWLAKDDPKRWAELLLNIGVLRNVTETYTTPTQTLPAGHSQFRIKDEVGLYLVHAVSAHGDILTYEQLQAINTELDKQDYDACIVATLGELSTEAQTLATQLASRKSIIVLERIDIIRRAIRNIPPGLERALLRTDPIVAAGYLVFTQGSLALLLQDRTTNDWFQILDHNGEGLPESSELVRAVRKELPALRSVRYAPPDKVERRTSEQRSALAAFSREEYLRKSHD